MSKITAFEDLECWLASRALANAILDICERSSLKYQYRLKDQLAGASISVMNNIAEGFARYSRQECVRFLNIAISSCAEVKSMTYLLIDRGIITQSEFEHLEKLIAETRNKTNGFIRYLTRINTDKLN